MNGHGVDEWVNILAQTPNKIQVYEKNKTNNCSQEN